MIHKVHRFLLALCFCLFGGWGWDMLRVMFYAIPNSSQGIFLALCSGITPAGTQELIMLGIEPWSATCKARAVPL